jgi:hypothetical protein
MRSAISGDGLRGGGKSVTSGEGEGQERARANGKREVSGIDDPCSGGQRGWIRTRLFAHVEPGRVATPDSCVPPQPGPDGGFA